MEDTPTVRILMIEDSDESARVIGTFLQRFEGARFEIVLCRTAEEGLRLATTRSDLDMILMDYYLPDRNGLDTTRELKDQKVDIPIAFLTVNTDVSVALEAMKLGVADYFLKDDLASHSFPQALMSILEKHKLRKEYAALEVKKRRLEAMQELVLDISRQITEPLTEMKRVVDSLLAHENAAQYMRFLTLIKENVERMDRKLEKLKNLRDDKTVQYIKDIRMIDLS